MSDANDRSDTSASLWRNRSFRRYFAGQFVTNAGDSLYTVALLWIVFDLSGSTALTGLANSMLLAPFLLQIVAGPIVDRVPVGRLLLASQLLQGAVVALLAVAAFANALTVPLALATIPVLSILTVVTGPIQSTLVPRILDEEQLSRGNSALATVDLGLDMLFDALGGLLVAAVGVTTLFLLDSVTFAVAAALFAGMAVPSPEDGRETAAAPIVSSYVADLRDGIALLRGTLFVEMLAVAAVFNFAVGGTLAILPAVGDSLGGPGAYGLLLGALGAGRLVGSLAAPALQDVPYGRLTAITSLCSAALWLWAALTPSLALTVGCFGLAWVSAGIDGVLTETLNQKAFSPSVLGRISAIKGTAATATLPIGSLVGGAVAGAIGVRTTMALAAAGFGVAGLWFALRTPLRRLPAVAAVRPATFGVAESGATNAGQTRADDE